MRISCCIIVCNGMPWIKYLLRNIYDFADEIIIVEGAVKSYLEFANPDGSSNDGTVEVIKSSPDPDKKIKIIQGLWYEKIQMDNEYMKIATGDFIFKMDSDELYKQKDLTHIRKVVEVSELFMSGFRMIHLWKNLYTRIRGGCWESTPPRLWRHEKGAKFIRHRPLAIQNPDEPVINLAGYKPLVHPSFEGVEIFHYSYLGDKKVYDKSKYFVNIRPRHPIYSRHLEWYNNVWKKWKETGDETEKRYGIHVSGDGHTEKMLKRHPEVIEEAIARGELNEYNS